MPGPGYKAKSHGGPGYTGSKKAKKIVRTAVKAGVPASTYTPTSSPAPTKSGRSAPKAATSTAARIRKAQAPLKQSQRKTEKERKKAKREVKQAKRRESKPDPIRDRKVDLGLAAKPSAAHSVPDFLKASPNHIPRKTSTGIDRIKSAEQRRAGVEVQPKRENPKIQGPKEKRVAQRLKKAATRTAKAPLPGLSGEQAKTARTILKVGKKMDVPRKHMLAAIQTGIVESNLTEIPGGDADSQNWRQEREEFYGDDWARTGGPLNTRASARRFYKEAASLDRGQSAGELAADVQRPREDLRFKYGDPSYTGGARKIVRKGSKSKPIPVKLQRKADRVLGEKAAAKIIKRAKQGSSEAGPLPGKLMGSQAMVRHLLGAKVKGDKEPGHSAGGMHDPGVGDAYAQDIGSAGGNPAENEPEYSQATVDRVVKRLRAMGSKIPKDFKLGQNWDGEVVRGYEIEFLTAPHGTGPHIHLGAKWTGAGSGAGVSSGGGTGGGLAGTDAGGKGTTSTTQKARRRTRSARRKLLEDILREGVGGKRPEPKKEDDEEDDRTPTSAERIRKRKVSLGL